MSNKDNEEKDVKPDKGLSANETAEKYRCPAPATGEQLKVVNDTLLSILKETSTSEGVDFFRLLLERLAETLGFRFAMVAEFFDKEKRTVTSLVNFANGRIIDNVTYDLAGTPCSDVAEGDLCIYPDNIREAFPKDQALTDLEIESYIGIPLVDSKGAVLGILNAFDTDSIEDVEFCRSIFTIFALRAGFELERLSCESERTQNAELLKAIMDNSPACIYIKDVDGRLLFVNSWLSRIPSLKDKQAVGFTDYDIMPHDVADNFRKNDLLTLESGSAQTFEEVLRQSDGTEQTFLSVKFPLPSMPGAICGISTDITERKRFEGSLVRANKLESIGRLAGGIAHDFNNVLLGVLGNASIAKAYLHSDHKVWSLLNDIEKAANRAKIVTRQLLTFSRGDVMIKELVEAGPLIYNRSKLLLNRHDISLDADLSDKLWSVEVDEMMIGQVIEHIMLNAAHSMPEGGSVELSGSNIVLTAGELPPLEAGKYVKVNIKDQGTGIPEDILPMLFDPFFTTKERASGLGLAVAYSITRKHGGSITVESILGQGATFSLYLPAVEVVSERFVQGENKVALEGRVLVMDDEEIIRDVSGEMLKLLGFDVDFALDGKEAIELYKKAKESGTPYKAVIMDLTIPSGMGGKEAIGKLVELDPGARVVVSSGYSRDPVMAKFKDFGFSAVLVKPYKFEEFSRVVKAVIGNY